MAVFARFTSFQIDGARCRLRAESNGRQARNHELAAYKMDRPRCISAFRNRLCGVDSHAAAGAVPCRRAADREAGNDASIAALKPPKRARPLIAIIGINDATETTDYLMPYGILRRADVADVMTLATKPGPMTLFPVLRAEPQATIAEFDRLHPDGADYVIVPAMSRDDDPSGTRRPRARWSLVSAPGPRS
jgi:hypothetical protein